MGEAAAIRVNQPFGPYLVRRSLGRGGMSDVYLVERVQDELHERFALKVMLTQFLGNPEPNALFEREVRIAATLRHPNIVRVVDFGAINDIPYLVLEYVHGLDLRTLCNRLATNAHQDGPKYAGQERGALPPEAVVWIGIGAARGLHAVHTQASDNGRLVGFVHRDVAPGNVFVDYYGQVKVADFGVSKGIHAGTEAVSTTAQARGRAFYMAPEQIGGTLTRASDLYSLGVLLFELLAGLGRHPFEDPRYPNQDPLGLMTRAARGERAFTIAEALPTLPSRLCALLEQLIRPDPAERPSAEHVTAELAAIAQMMDGNEQAGEGLARWALRLVYSDGPPTQTRTRAIARGGEDGQLEPPTAVVVRDTARGSGVRPAHSDASEGRSSMHDPSEPNTARGLNGSEPPTSVDVAEGTSGIQPSVSQHGTGPIDTPPQHGGAPSSQPILFGPGVQVGPFRIVREIAKGGMGATYVAKREDVDKRVCLKTILPAHAADPLYREMFLSEAKTAAKASHPNLVSLIDFGQHDSGALWIAYELVDGTDLGTLLKSSPDGALYAEHVACIASDVARALLHLHTADHRRGVIVHRDVSPRNVMLSYDGEATLIDFGIAKMTLAESTQTGVKGKLPYMAPEMLRGDSIGPPVDQWALGVMLYRLLTGRLPYKNAYDGSRPPPPSPPSRRGTLDPRWGSILERLLQPDPAHRYPSLAEMLEELGPLIPGPGARLSLGRGLRRKRPPPSALVDSYPQHDSAEPDPIDVAPPRSTPARDVGELQPGERFGEWVIARKLGTGGMAVVYEATRTRSIGGAQRAALKLIRPEHAASDDFRARFGAEVEIAMRLNHQNIVHVLDAGVIEGVCFMAMEYVDGCDLDTLVRALTKHGLLSERRLPPELALFIGVGLLHGLEYAHGAGVVHRDVSPHNVMATVAGEVKLTDFGVAKPMRADGMASKTSHAVGKPHYMPPEQFRGDPLDGRADLFAAGVSLYELLAGASPYAIRGTPNETFHMVVKRVFENDRPHVAEVAPHTPPELVDVLERLLQPHREHRPKSAEEVLTVLEPLVQLKTKRVLAELVRAVKDEAAGPLSASVLEAVRISAAPAQVPSNRTAPLPAAAQSPRAQPWTDDGAAPPKSSRTLALVVALLALVVLGLGAFAAVLFWPTDTASTDRARTSPSAGPSPAASPAPANTGAPPPPAVEHAETAATPTNPALPTGAASQPTPAPPQPRVAPSAPTTVESSPATAEVADETADEERITRPRERPSRSGAARTVVPPRAAPLPSSSAPPRTGPRNSPANRGAFGL